MDENDATFSAEDAVKVQGELRSALGLAAERFPLSAFVGMISDEIEMLRASGRSDPEIAAIIARTLGRDIGVDALAMFYASPEARRRDG